jgi:hypothetical protein
MEPLTRQHLVTIQPARSPMPSSPLPRLARGSRHTLRCSSTMPILLSKLLQLDILRGVQVGIFDLVSHSLFEYTCLIPRVYQ